MKMATAAARGNAKKDDKGGGSGAETGARGKGSNEKNDKTTADLKKMDVCRAISPRAGAGDGRLLARTLRAALHEDTPTPVLYRNIAENARRIRKGNNMVRTLVATAIVLAVGLWASAREASPFRAAQPADGQKAAPENRGKIIEELKADYGDVVDKLDKNNLSAQLLARQQRIAENLKKLLEDDDNPPPPPSSDAAPMPPPQGAESQQPKPPAPNAEPQAGEDARAADEERRRAIQKAPKLPSR